MNNESTPNDEKELSQEELLDRARQLLKLTDLVDRYPAVVERRVTGLVYVLIGGGVALLTLFFTSLMTALESLGLQLISIVFFVIGSLSIAFIITFRLVTPLTKSYTSVSTKTEPMSNLMKAFWGVFCVIIVISAAYFFGTGQANLFPIVIQAILGFSNSFIYYGARSDAKNADYAHAHLILVLLIFASLIPIVLFPEIAFAVMILVDIGGLYGLGIYMLVTAERILVRTLDSE
ncbi:MAG: hypothetical protein ACFFEF_08980 [Candidatus Thorarchaeota archaeon]